MEQRPAEVWKGREDLRQFFTVKRQVGPPYYLPLSSLTKCRNITLASFGKQILLLQIERKLAGENISDFFFFLPGTNSCPPF